MPLIVAIDLIVVGALVAIALIKGFEQALPFFAFAITLLPYDSKIPLPGLFDLTTTRIAIVTLAVLYVALGRNAVENGRSRGVPLNCLVLLYFAWTLIATLNSIVFTSSLKFVISNFLDFYLAYYIFTKTISQVRTVHNILIAFVVALTVCSALGWFEPYFHWKVIDLFPAVKHVFTPGVGGVSLDEGRVRSTFPHAILFANALALGIPWALYLLTLAVSRVQRTCLWAAVVLMFWVTYKTMSRGPWLALMMSLVLLLLFSQAKTRKHLVIIALLIISVLVIRRGVWDTLKNTYFETQDPDSPRGSSYQYRYTLMRVGREALAKVPSREVWGFGPQSWLDVGLEYEDLETGHMVKCDSCDSAWVGIMVETGYVGLFLVATLLIKAALFSLRGFSRLPKPANLLCLIFLINIISYVFMMLSVANFGWGQQTYTLWIILALSMVYPGLVQPEDLAKGRALFPWQEARPQLAEVSQPRA